MLGASLRFEKPADGRYVDVRSNIINEDRYYLRTVFGQAGKYRVHITLVNEGQKVDAHVPFTVGTSQSGLSGTTYLVIAVVLFALGYIFYLSNPAFQAAVDRVLKKKSA